MSTHLFATMKFHDARRATTLLTALGFREVALYVDENDPAVVQHAEYAWGDGGGGLIFGSVGAGDPDLDRRAGLGAVYLTVPDADDVDRIHAAALAAGATSAAEPSAPDYGGREAAILDAEGNRFSFGTFSGAGPQA